MQYQIFMFYSQLRYIFANLSFDVDNPKDYCKSQYTAK